MIKVVAAVIEKDGKVLFCKRGAGGNCPFLWEFPGGKIEPGEIFCEYPFSYPEKEIYFYFIKAKLLSGKIEATFHSETKWLSPAESESLEFCPADVFAAEKLKGEYKK